MLIGNIDVTEHFIHYSRSDPIRSSIVYPRKENVLTFDKLLFRVVIKGMQHAMAFAGGADKYLARTGFDVFQRTKQGLPLITTHPWSEL